MTKASMSRSQRRREKQEAKKERTEVIRGTTEGVVSSISYTVDALTNEVTFNTPMVNTFVEARYERPRKPKVLHRIPINAPNAQFSCNDALLRNFDKLLAIDTNTRQIGQHKVSTTGIMLGEFIRNSNGRDGLSWRCPFCLELTDVIAGQEERIGWVEALHALHCEALINSKERLGVIVDAHLNDLPAINARRSFMYGNVVLPKNVTLIYATADAGGEYWPNAMIRSADSCATLFLDYVAAGKAPPLNMDELCNGAYKGYRVVYGRQRT